VREGRRQRMWKTAVMLVTEDRVATRAKNPRNRDVVDIVISMNNDSMAAFTQCYVLMDSEPVDVVYQLIVYQLFAYSLPEYDVDQSCQVARHGSLKVAFQFKLLFLILLYYIHIKNAKSSIINLPSSDNSQPKEEGRVFLHFRSR
jgi:hypothetical protein